MANKDPDRGLFQRGRRWYLRCYVAGRGRQVFALKPQGAGRATTDKAVARVLARQVRQRIADGAAAKQSQDLGDLLAEFTRLGTLTGQEKHARFNAGVVRRFLDSQGVRSPSEITSAAVERYLGGLRREGRAAATLWNHRAALSRFCGFLETRALLDGNPVRKVAVPKIEKALPIFLTPSQAAEAIKIAGKHGFHGEVPTALYTGLRRAELRRLEWRDIDFDGRVLLVRKSKSHRPRAVPLSQEALAVLQEHQGVTGDRKYLFPGRDRLDQSGMRRFAWWSEAIKPLQQAMPEVFNQRDAGAVGRAWHLFRHTFASWLVQEGVSIYKVSEWLGHSDIRTTQAYSHLAPKYDAEIEKLHKEK